MRAKGKQHKFSVPAAGKKLPRPLGEGRGRGGSGTGKSP